MPTVKLGNAALTQVIQDVVIGELIVGVASQTSYDLDSEATLATVAVYVSGTRLLNKLEVAPGVSEFGVSTTAGTTSITLHTTLAGSISASDTIIVDYVKA